MIPCEKKGVYQRGKEICQNCPAWKRERVGILVNKMQVYSTQVDALAYRLYARRRNNGGGVVSTIDQQNGDTKNAILMKTREVCRRLD